MTDNISVTVVSSAVLNSKKEQQCLTSVNPTVDVDNVDNNDPVLRLSCTEKLQTFQDEASFPKSSISKITQCHQSQQKPGWGDQQGKSQHIAKKNVNGDHFPPLNTKDNEYNQVSISQNSETVSSESERTLTLQSYSENCCCSNKSIINKPNLVSNPSMINGNDCDVKSKLFEIQKLNGVSHVSCTVGDNGVSKYLLKEYVGENATVQGVNNSCPQQTVSSHFHTNFDDVEENLCDTNDNAATRQSFSEASASTSRENDNGLLGGFEKVSLHGDQQATMKSDDVINGVTYIVYQSERQMPDIMRLITKDLSEPYSIYTYRYFIHNWPKLCFLAEVDGKCVGAIVCKLDLHKKMVRRGYIAMLAVDSEYRRRQIGSTLVTKAIQAMIRDDCDEVVLETEITNLGALHLYENLGFVRDKRLFRYYLNGVDALRLKLWLR